MENSADEKTGNQEGLHARAVANCLQLAIENFLAPIHEVHMDSRLSFSVCMLQDQRLVKKFLNMHLHFQELSYQLHHGSVAALCSKLGK